MPIYPATRTIVRKEPTMTAQYEHAINCLRGYLRDQEVEPGDRLPSERAFAERLSLARPALNKAIACLIAEGLLRREGYKLYYVGASAPAPGLPPIHIIHPRSQVYYRRGPIEAAHDVARAFGTHTVPVLTGLPDDEREALARLLRDGTAGFVLWALREDCDADLLAQFRRMRVPFVVCDQNVGDCDFVGVDNAAGARLAVEHLGRIGHRNIAYLTQSLKLPSLAQRCAGYRAACLETRLNNAAGQVIEIPTHEEEHCREAYATLRREYPRATAFVASNDILALRVLACAREDGLRLPDDLSAVGFDDIEAAAHATPALTTVHQDFYEIGYVAAQQLFRRMGEGKAGAERAPVRLRLEPRLVERASTVPPAERRGKSRDTRQKRETGRREYR